MNQKDRRVETETQKLIDKGVLIHSGWRAYRSLALTHVARDSMVTKRCQEAFEAGCALMFAVLCAMMDSDYDEPTPDDTRRLDALAAEVHAIDLVLREKYGKKFAPPH